MTSRWTGIATAAAALALASAPAWGACSVVPFPVPVTMQHQQPVITVKVDGEDARFLVDSGAYASGVSAQFALDRKLPATKVGTTGTHIQVEAGAGLKGVANIESVAAVVQTKDLNMSGIKFTNWNFMTFKRWNQGSETAPIGIFGQDILGLLDVEYDLAHGSFKMVRVADCKDAALAYWATGGAPYSVLPLQFDQRNPHTEAEIIINGQKMRAVFDTGAYTSFITERAAKRAGVAVTDAGVTETGQVQGIDGPVQSWSARFASVKVGDEEIHNGLLEIGRTQNNDFDVLIGADFFLAHHVYVANSQRKLYFTYNGGQVFNIVR